MLLLWRSRVQTFLHRFVKQAVKGLPILPHDKVPDTRYQHHLNTIALRRLYIRWSSTGVDGNLWCFDLLEPCLKLAIIPPEFFTGLSIIQFDSAV
jgi:hypothetical protein